MSQQVWKVIGCEINSTEIPVADATLDPAIDAFLSGAGSSVFPTIAGVRVTKPMVQLSTLGIKAAIDLISLTAGLAVTQLDLYCAQVDNIGYASGSVHKKITVSEGLALIRRVGSSGSDDATCDIDVYCTMDGTNLPFVTSESVALFSDTALADSWTTGKFKYSSLFEVESIEYATNWKVHFDPHSGLPYATFAGIMSGEPQISITTKDLALLADVGNGGVAAVAPIIFFRHNSESSPGRDADATETHISITVPKGLLIPGQLSSRLQEAATQSLILQPRKDGANAIVTVDTTAAIA